MPTPWSRLEAEALELHSPPHRSKGTRDTYRQALREYRLTVHPRTASDLAPIGIGRFVAASSSTRSWRTTHKLLRALRATARYALACGYIRNDPFGFRSPSQWLETSRRNVTEDTRPPLHLTPHDVRRLLDQVDAEALCGSWQASRLRALIYTLAFTGARKREVLGLKCNDVDTTARVLWIRTNDRRGLKTARSAAPLALTLELHQVLTSWIPSTGSIWLFPNVTRSGPWLGGGPDNKAIDHVRDLGRRAGIPGLTMLRFRHTIGTLAEAWGFSELELQRWLRHARTRTQDHYRAADIATLQLSASRITYPPGTRQCTPSPTPSSSSPSSPHPAGSLN